MSKACKHWNLIQTIEFNFGYFTWLARWKSGKLGSFKHKWKTPLFVLFMVPEAALASHLTGARCIGGVLQRHTQRPHQPAVSFNSSTLQDLSDRMVLGGYLGHIRTSLNE